MAFRILEFASILPQRILELVLVGSRFQDCLLCCLVVLNRSPIVPSPSEHALPDPPVRPTA